MPEIEHSLIQDLDDSKSPENKQPNSDGQED